MTGMPEFISLLVIAYLIGSIPMAFLIVKWRYGVDIRKYDSGVVGGSNVFRNFSKPWGIAVGLYDAGKGALLVWIADLLGMGLEMQIAIGAAVICGHNWPIFLRFNAGRGLATTLGVACYLFPLGIWAFVAAAIFTLLLGSSPLPVLVGMVAFPIASWLYDEPLALTLGLTGYLLILIFRRLSAPLTSKSRPVSRIQMLLNRLLFDRDTRDEKAWITFNPVTWKKLRRKQMKKDK
jgi:glycerol-3-phosphate acyltransferase PlsY